MTTKALSGWLIVLGAVCLAGTSCGSDTGSGDTLQSATDSSQLDSDAVVGPTTVVGMVAFIPASDGQSVTRVTFPGGESEEIAFPDGGLSGKLMAVHFSSATSGAALVRSADATAGTVYDYDSPTNAWKVRASIPSDQMLPLADGMLPSQVFSDSAGNLLVMKAQTVPGQNMEGQPVWSLNLQVLFFSAGSNEPVIMGDGTAGIACVDPACPQVPDWVKMRVLGVSSLAPEPVIHFLLDPRTGIEDTRSLLHFRWTPSGAGLASITEPPYGSRELLGSFDQRLKYLMGPDPMYCDDTNCEEVPATTLLPLIHSYGPPVAFMSPGSLGPGSVSLFDFRSRMYEMEISIPDGSDDTLVQGYFPDERGPQWVRLVTWTEGTETATEFSVNMDTFEVTGAGDPTYSNLMAKAEGNGHFSFIPGYFYYVTE